MTRYLLPLLLALAVPSVAAAIPAPAAPHETLLATFDNAAPVLVEVSLGQTPAPEAAPAVAPAPAEEDPLALAGAIIAAAKAKKWLLAIPPFIVLVLLGIRRFGKRLPGKLGQAMAWFDTKRGGYVLAAVAAFATALTAAASAPNAAGVLQVLLAAFLIWIANDKVHELLKALLWPTGAQLAEESGAKGAAVQAAAGDAASVAAGIRDLGKQ